VVISRRKLRANLETHVVTYKYIPGVILYTGDEPTSTLMTGQPGWRGNQKRRRTVVGHSTDESHPYRFLCSNQTASQPEEEALVYPLYRSYPKRQWPNLISRPTRSSVPASSSNPHGPPPPEHHPHRPSRSSPKSSQYTAQTARVSYPSTLSQRSVPSAS